MDYISYQKRLDYLLELIQKNRFLSIESTAKRFDCSTRTIKRMINNLRDQGNVIQYDRQQKKYFVIIEEKNN
ncbi:DeoR family transcriptional regulator [Mucilaginibacter sp. cycad4]|uniref:DeoR family transcriptional regulator n=1 Tax=Mucilaginibacter sp. cycad4 TaxID=3342096 RepID=UPI0035A0A857